MNMTDEQPIILDDKATNKYKSIVLQVCGVFFILGILFFSFIFFLNSPTKNFPDESTISIEPGTSVSEIVEAFEKAHYVRSADLLYAYLVLEHDAKDVKAGEYYFEEALSTRGVASVITNIGPSEPLLSLTFPEGIRATEFARIAEMKLTQFDAATFIENAPEHEGYLFPDTYFIPKTFTDQDLLDLLLQTFEEKLEPLQQKFNNHELSEREIVILASIIEREANTAESKKLVASVFANRLEIGMPLQADASIEYILDKPLSELVPADLEIDSPYNTYVNPGLPPTPIGNPGLDAINAVLEPTLSDYFYYITDDDGQFHFAKTLTEHNRNIARYLR